MGVKLKLTGVDLKWNRRLSSLLLSLTNQWKIDLIVGAMIVGAMIVGAMMVGAMIVGAMIVGAMIVGVMRLSLHNDFLQLSWIIGSNVTES